MRGRGGPNRPLRRLWGMAAPRWGRLALAASLATLALSSAVGLVVVSAWLISRASQQPPILHLQVAIVAVRAFGISRGVLRYAERLVGHDAALRSLVEIRVSVFDRLERLSPAGLGTHRHGDLLARLVGDVDSTVDLFVRVLLPAVAGILAGALAAGLGAALLPAAGAALLVLLLVAGVLAPWLGTLLGSRAQEARADAEGRLLAHVVGGLAAAPDLLAHGAVEHAVAAVASADSDLTALDRRAATAAGASAALTQLATGLTIVACLGLGVTAVQEARMDGVWLAALALIPMAMADVLSGLPAAALARARVQGAARRILAVMDAPDPVPAPVPGQPRATAPSPGHPPALALRSMAARYPAAGDDAVAGVSLDLPPGRRIALVGPSGSGKSTVAAVLLRMLDHRAGAYLLDGTDVRDLAEDDVRAQIGVMDQRAHLFDTTIEENIRLANRAADDAALRSALERAALADWVDGLPQGLATRVGAHGSAVSGGQAQRIALARVLLADRPVVVLDEPGEHLDPSMADEVTRAAVEQVAGRSLVLITHRMAHTGACDEVVVLSGGTVLQRGAPAGLTTGWYADALAREHGMGAGMAGAGAACGREGVGDG